MRHSIGNKRRNEKVAAQVRAVLEVAQKATEQKKATKVAATVQAVEAATTHVDEG